MIPNPCYTENGPFKDVYDYTPYLTDIEMPVIVLNSILLFLIFISYFPQVIKLYRSGSVHGISFLFLHFTGYSLLFSTMVFYATTLPQILACRQNPALCYANMIPFLQSFTFLAGMIWWYGLSTRLLRKERLQCIITIQIECEQELDSQTLLISNVPPSNPAVIKASWHIFAFYLFLLITIVTASGITAFVLLYGMCDKFVRGFTLSLSVISLGFSLTQFTPQIHYTCKVKAPGNISIFLVNTQFLVVACMFAFAIISRADWLTYLSMVSATAQLFILALLLDVYSCRDCIQRRNCRKGQADEAKAEIKVLES